MKVFSDAQVLLDGEVVGNVQTDGTSRLPSCRGRYSVEIRLADYLLGEPHNRWSIRKFYASILNVLLRYNFGFIGVA